MILVIHLNLFKNQTDLVWRYERYLLIREYFDRPPLFPPFIILTHVYDLFKLFGRCCLARRRNQTDFEGGKSFSKYYRWIFFDLIKKFINEHLEMIAIPPKVDEEWSEFENYATNYYARTIVSGQRTTSAALVPSKTRQETQLTTIDTSMIPSAPSTIDMKTISDELSSMRRVIGDLRIHAEEVCSSNIVYTV